jgi:hypothetical protein
MYIYMYVSLHTYTYLKDKLLILGDCKILMLHNSSLSYFCSNIHYFIEFHTDFIDVHIVILYTGCM